MGAPGGEPLIFDCHGLMFSLQLLKSALAFQTGGLEAGYSLWPCSYQPLATHSLKTWSGSSSRGRFGANSSGHLVADVPGFRFCSIAAALRLFFGLETFLHFFTSACLRCHGNSPLLAVWVVYPRGGASIVCSHCWDRYNARGAP